MVNKTKVRQLQKSKLQEAWESGKISEASVQLVESLVCNSLYSDWIGKRLFVLYHPLPDEVSMLDLIQKHNLDKYAFVRVESDAPLPDMTLRLANLNCLPDWEQHQIPNGSKLYQPSKEMNVIDLNEPLLLLVPGLGFDKKGRRLGRGKGYYDRLISKCSDVVTVGVASQFHMCDSIPVDKWDIPMQYLLTEEGLEKVSND